MRRINSMKLVRAIPEVQEKIETGELSLTVAANIQSFFQTDAKFYSQEEKTELIDECLGKSSREVEKELARRNPEREKREYSKYVSEERIRLSFTITEDLNQKIDRLRSLLSHVEPNMSLEGLFERLIEFGLDKHDPVRKMQRADRRAAKSTNTVVDKAKTNIVPATEDAEREHDDTALGSHSIRAATPHESDSQRTLRDWREIMKPLPAQETVRSRAIPAKEKAKLHNRHDGLGCDYIDAQSGRRCGADDFLQIDHITPFAHGGAHEAENFQYLCGAHNRLKWRTQNTQSTKTVAREPNRSSY